jgi:hypothetical protein
VVGLDVFHGEHAMVEQEVSLLRVRRALYAESQQILVAAEL